MIELPNGTDKNARAGRRHQISFNDITRSMTSFTRRNHVVATPVFAQRVSKGIPGVSIESEPHEESRLCRAIAVAQIHKITDNFLALDN